ncbi:MAG: hypothetical protein CMJ29_00875 [Phycisphaerae bacterium]|nr:hypothetical protein [Phycisphaerae bacterium]
MATLETAKVTGPAPRMGFGLGSRLSFMMFLQYAIWGAWLPLLYPFLKNYRGFEDGQIGWLFMAGGFGAILGPFIAGQVADRLFNTEKFLGLSHIAGAIVVWFLGDVTNFWIFLGLSLLYSVIYAPTIALTNSLAFHHMPDRDRDFGWVRLWGTVGWIVVGIGIGQWLLHMHTPADGTMAEATLMQSQGMQDAFRLSAILGVLMGLYCFTLPKTPPQKGEEEFALLETAREIKRNPLLILFLLAIPVSMIHQFYFVYTSQFIGEYQNNFKGFEESINSIFGVGGGGLMTIGQMSEIVVLFLIPFIAGKWSRKSLLAIGLIAYALRMFLFSQITWLNTTLGIPDVVILITGVTLHGLCFGCFIFVAFMVVDEETTKDVKATAQNLFNLVIVGVGIVLGSYIANNVMGPLTMVEVMKDGQPVMENGAAVMERDWSLLFSVPMYAALACLAILLAFYPRSKKHVAG